MDNLHLHLFSPLRPRIFILISIHHSSSSPTSKRCRRQFCQDPVEEGGLWIVDRGLWIVDCGGIMITEHKSSNHSFSKDEKIKVRALVKIYQDNFHNFYQTPCPQYTAPASGDLAHISTLVSTQIKKRYGRPKQSADSYHPLSLVFVCISISISLFIVSIFVFL